ncbi:MAG: hypothetical protein SWO11_23570 [Thermodesulfobacteriota bacterium]|nr:hypothetical protein [Thermodesulfobacteriota bacterium]
MESYHRAKDGRIFSVEIVANYVKFSGNEYNCAFTRDISERKKVEEDRKKLISELHEALNEIKTLRAILPLCSFCKKIRDDKGYWEQVDVYINKYLKADISHSICPECMKKHYPKECDRFLLKKR